MQREDQIQSLQITIEVLKGTESGLKDMLRDETSSREAAEEKLRAMQATIKCLDSPSLHNSPALVPVDDSYSEPPSLADSSRSYDRSISLTPEPETPGLVLFDADDLAASVPCDIVESATVTRLSSGLGLGLDFG